MHSVSGSTRWETVSPTLHGDDSTSKVDSEEFDTTIRPDYKAVDIEDRTRSLQENADTTLSTVYPNTGYAPWLSNGDDISDTEETSLLHDARHSQSISPTPSGGHYTHLPVGHPSYRKPVPRLEDYDRLFPTRPPPKLTTSGKYSHVP